MSNHKTKVMFYYSVKLNHENYLLWKSMVLPVIRGNRLEGFIKGTKECPPEFIIKEDFGFEEVHLNPDYENWIAQDQTLLGWLYNSINVEVASEVMGNESSEDLWKALETLFGVQTRSNIVFFKKEFRRMRKGGLKMSEYLKTMKKLADNLALAGQPIGIDDLVSQVLAGLDSLEYNSVVYQINEKEHVTWMELQSILLTAYVASPETLNDPAWFVDSGASSHITNDPGILTQKNDYNESFTFQKTESANSTCLVSSKEIWHRRLGYPSSKILSKVLANCKEKLNSKSKFHFCDACQFGKSHLLPFPISDSHASQILDLIHTDVWGPAPIQSTSGFRYYMHFLDDHSRYTWIFPLKFKSEAFSTFLQFKTLVENQFERKIKCVQSDMGGEYRKFSEFVKQNGVTFRHPCPHTLAQNGRAERKHRHITETGLTLLAQACMPTRFWWEAFQTSTFLINRLPTPVLKDLTPLEKMSGKLPDYKALKTFGCACFPCLRPYPTHKFQFHSTKCVFLGYSESHKGYKCLSSTGRIYISRHVIFNELEFPFKIGFLNTKEPPTNIVITNTNWLNTPTTSHDPVIPRTQPAARQPSSEGP
ncbi:hypothetical protein UlMin_033375 [Ulmus minor]